MKNKIILGISSFYHDSSAALIINGVIIAAAQEERFTRIKHDSSFPINAIKYVINEWGGEVSSISIISFYEKPFLKFERILENVHALAPRGIFNYINIINDWLGYKLNTSKTIKHHLKKIGINEFKVLYPEHHLSHAASAYYPSPFEESAILTVDGVGEWATTTVMHAKGNSITKLKEIRFPHSLGLFYSTFTSFCGFKVNDGEYKMMGLAPYADPNSNQVLELINIIKTNIILIHQDGSFTLNLEYFYFGLSQRMYNEEKWFQLFNVKANNDTSFSIPSIYIQMSCAVQKITEEVYLKLALHTKELTNSSNLCISGGVALNCVANGVLKKKNIFKNIWIQPASGDAGSSVGCALAVHHIYLDEKKDMLSTDDAMRNSLLGPSYHDQEISDMLTKKNAIFTTCPSSQEVAEQVAALLAKGNIVGWFKGRMEFGPRALGNRSIFADSRDSTMQSKINEKVKFREQFRPFAPIVKREDVNKYFDFTDDSPYMLFVASVQKDQLHQAPENYNNFSLREKLIHKKSTLPSITHVDNSARIQTVTKTTNPYIYSLLDEFEKLTGCSVLINTSFNSNNEPIVCSPTDAYNCFMKTNLDFLILENFILSKKEQIINI
jgi:carbamoyltransferase